MKKILLFIFLLVILTGCNLNQLSVKIQPLNQAENLNQPTGTTINFLVSNYEYTKYCNGADMDSEGYKNSLTVKETKIIPQTNLTQEQLLTQTIDAASEKANLTSITSMDQNFLKIVDDTVYIEPIEGWAGVSIFLCAWKPLVEVNLLQFPEIKKVKWVSDLQKWEELNQ